MFVGEQRFTEEFVTEFMELYRCSLEEKRYDDKLQTAKGGVIKINPGAKFAGMDEDPDDQQNQKLGGKPKEEEEEEEEDEEEEDEEEEDEEEEEEDDEQEKPEGDHDVSKRSHMNTSRALLTEGAPIIRPVSRELNARELKIRPSSKTSDITEMNKDSMNLVSNNNMGDEEAEEEDEEISEEDEEEEEDESPKSIKKADELSLSHSHSNLSENIPVYSIEKTFKKQTSSKNFIRGDAPSIFNKSKIINNSTMRLDFDDHEEKLDYRL